MINDTNDTSLANPDLIFTLEEGVLCSQTRFVLIYRDFSTYLNIVDKISNIGVNLFNVPLFYQINMWKLFISYTGMTYFV